MIEFIVGFGVCLVFFIVGIVVLKLCGLLSSWKTDFQSLKRLIKQVDSSTAKTFANHEERFQLLKDQFTKDLELQRVTMSQEFNAALDGIKAQLDNRATHEAATRSDKGAAELYERIVDRPVSDYIPGGE